MDAELVRVFGLVLAGLFVAFAATVIITKSRKSKPVPPTPKPEQPEPEQPKPEEPEPEQPEPEDPEPEQPEPEDPDCEDDRKRKRWHRR